MTSCLDLIDAIIYINLEHRKDRNEHIIHEIKKIDPTLSKTHRIEAEYVPENGALGCSVSHVRALELCFQHPEWSRCLILEDDFTFVSPDESNFQLTELILSCPQFDMLLLSFGIDSYITEQTMSPHINRVLSSQTTSGYIVHKDYMGILLNNFRISSDILRNQGRCHEGCLDQYWKRLMPMGRWYAYHTRIGYQYANYSDIENVFHNYEC
jgi:GR25 family glycosyltransferase involved in LPS biosynthesis